MEKRILAIDIAEKSLRYVYGVKNKTAYTLRYRGKTTTEEGLSSSGVLSREISHILENTDIRPQKICVSISHQEALVHQKMLPQMPKHEMARVVQDEIGKIPRFSAQEFDFIYQEYTASKRGRSHVLYAALKQSFLTQIFKEIRAAKIDLSAIEISPLNLKELAQLTDPSISCEALLVLHDTHSYLVVHERQEYRLVYKMSCGTNQMAAHLTCDKKEQMIKAWTSEINRVVRSFLLENKHIPLTEARFIWDQELMPGFDRELQDHLHLDLKPLRLSEIPKFQSVDGIEENAIYAVALTPLACEAHKVKEDFSFQHFTRKAFLMECIFKTAGQALLALAILACGLGMYNHQLFQGKHRVQMQMNKAERDIKQIKKKSQELYQLHDEYMQVKERLLEQAQYVQKLNRVSWTQVLSEFAQELPPDVSLTSFKFNESGQARIKGAAINMESIAQFIRKMENSRILTKGNFDFLKEKMAEEKYYLFGIIARLKTGEEKGDDTQKN